MFKRLIFLFCLVLTLSLFSGVAVENRAFAAKKEEKKELTEKQKTTRDNYLKYGEEAMKTGWYGNGFYFSMVKFAICLLGFWVWVYMIDWMNRDAEVLKNPNRTIWNCINCGLLIFVGGFGAMLIIPIFWIGLGISLVAFWVPVLTYSTIRNKPLPPHERVFTADHIYFKLGRMLRMKTTPPKQAWELGPPIALQSMQKDLSKTELDARTLLARNHDGFNQYRFILATAIFKRATGVMFDFTETETQVRFQIDGVWHLTQTINREQSDPLLESAKILVGANPHERRKRQQGMFVAVLEQKNKYEAEFISQGVPNGEKALVQFQVTKVPFNTAEDLGLVDPELTKIKNALAIPEGVVVFSAPLANGLRSSSNVFLRMADRFVRDFVTVEDEQNKYQFVENIPVTFYDSAKGEFPTTVLPDVFFKEPQALVLRDMVNNETLELCCNETQNTRLILTTIRAKDCAEVIFKFLSLGVSPQLFASKLAVISCQRLIRRLCPDCKEAFQPASAMLQKLGIKPGTVNQLYRVRSAPQEGEKQLPPCIKCNDIGYFGRTAMFEILEVNDTIRKVILASKSVEELRIGLQKAGHRGFIPSGLALVAKGITSVDELTRILKM
ncbi:MAG: Flp pilus assembly complex ATPase component TadA [Planctomycetaceae bacterium]|jgi:type II secretory ATPase GspE/PulE/Tfp pilus assembly ATPase PilB-like protein|nr:Flp pilus assembly complex ATPase component TadA [Planctomycetaceae bacterium]